MRGLAHVTGGGLPGNLSRVLPSTCDAVVHREAWVTDEEMTRVFNLGIGMVAVVAPADVPRAHDALRSHGVASVEIGEVVPGEGAVHLT